MKTGDHVLCLMFSKILVKQGRWNGGWGNLARIKRETAEGTESLKKSFLKINVDHYSQKSETLREMGIINQEKQARLSQKNDLSARNRLQQWHQEMVTCPG